MLCGTRARLVIAVDRAATAREALVAELMGDVARLLDRFETLEPVLTVTHQALTSAADNLAAAVVPLEARIATLAGHVETRAIEHIARQSQEVARAAFEEQRRAMSDAARRAFETEVGPAVLRLGADLRSAVRRIHSPWETWLTHAATAVTAALASAMLVVYLLPR